MDQDRWKTVNHIFHAALEVSPRERHSFVLTASNGDSELQAEVELLLKADQDAGSYLESPLVPGETFSSSPPPVSPGDVLCNRFRILRAVGEGGMGHVFEAYDSELAVRVALKIIRPEIASNPEALHRFRQEVRLARRITHPNVCRTFDIERETRVVDPVSNTKQEVVFLTMEFLEGETLDSWIKRTGSLPLDEALHVARQIADALTAAHAIGIVHRDMKPANVMLVPVESSGSHAFRAVITDFGLARLDTALPQGSHSALSHSGRPIGTLAYMAPEQLGGTAVSTATDIYTFGLILFEMATGARAFPSDNFLSGIAKRLNGPPPSAETLVPDLPVPWCGAIEGCLRLKPSDRIQSPAGVIEVLDGRRTNLPPIRRPAFLRRTALTSWSIRRRTMAVAGFVCVLLALFFISYRLYQSREDSRVNPGALVYLTPVKNQTGEKTLDNLTELFQAELAQSVQITLLDQGRVGDTLQTMTKSPDTVINQPVAREIALRTGTARVVFASVTGSGGTYSLNIDIQALDGTSPLRVLDHWQESFPWQDTGKTSTTIPSGLLTAVRKSSSWIRREVGESRNDIARLDAPPEDVTTGSWQALADYSQAEKLIAAGEREEAVILLQNAVMADPKFALAYGTLGDVLDSIGRSTEGYTYYTQALSVDLENRLTRRERDRIRGMFALDTGDEQSAESAFRDYAAYYEHDYAGWFYRAYPLLMLGRTDEAIETLKKAYELDTKRLSAPAHLARFYLVKNDHASAWKWQQWLATNGFKEDADFAAGQIDLDEQKYSDAESSFKAMLQSPDPSYQSLAWSLLARYFTERGEYDRAVDALNHGIDLDTAHGFIAEQSSKLIDRATVRCKLSDPSHAFADIRRAVDEDSGLQTIQSAASAFGRCKGAARGSLDSQVVPELTHLEQLLPRGQANSILATVSRTIVRGELLLARGDWRSAIKEFSHADALEAPGESREYLARAYLIASEKEPDLGDRLVFRERAFEAFGEMVRKEPMVWYLMLVLPPGIYGDALASYSHLGVKLHKDTAVLAPTLLEFSKLRGSQFRTSPDLINALSQSNDLGKHLTTYPPGE
jgi:eukaryotic-like serine/threonine-protein kinase